MPNTRKGRTIQTTGARLPLMGVRAYYTPESLTKTPKIRWLAYTYAK